MSSIIMFQTISAAVRWLTEPPVTLPPIQKRQARLLMMSALTIIGVAILYESFYSWVTQDFYGIQAIFGIIIALAAAHFLSRRGYVKLAALLIVLVPVLGILVMIASSDHPDKGIELLQFMVVPLLIGGIFFSTRSLWKLSILFSFGILSLTIFTREIKLIDLLTGPISFLWIVTVIISVSSRHRDALEAEHQAELAQSELRFRQMAENIQEAFWTYELSTDRINYVSPAYEKVLGQTRESFYADPNSILKVVYSEDSLDVHNVIKKIGEGNSISIETRIVHPDGSLHWVWSRGFPILDGQGTALGMAGIITDITERKQAEEILRQSEEKYLRIFHTSPTLIANTELGSGKYIDVNDTFLQTLEYAREEVIGHTPAELNIFVRSEQAATALQIMQAQGKLRDYEVEVRAKSGKIHYGLFSAEFIQLNGSPYLLTAMNDITKLKLMESELKAAQDNLLELNHTLEDRVRQRSAEVQDLYDNAPAGYHSLDEHGIIVMINQTELNWLGYTREEVVGVKNFRDLHVVESRPIFDKGFQLLKELGRTKDIEIEVLRKDGTILPVLLNSTAVYDDSGKFIQSRATITDITKRRQAEIALRESHDELRIVNNALEKTARLKDDFLASMSHELRSPLTGILGLSEALQLKIYGELSARQQKTVKSIEDSGRHLLELINDILDLSKIEADKVELDLQPCSLADICQASLHLIKGMAQQKYLYVEYAPLTEPVVLLADVRRLKQILVNLLSNAVKFTPENGKLGLEVQADKAGQEIRLTVWDKGIGIKPEDMDKLFKPFTQINSSLTREYAGTGLGLSLVQRLVKLHNGNVEVNSVFGQGSRFTITLPWLTQNTLAVSSKPNNDGQSSFETELTRSQLPLVMIADDNEIILEMIANLLESKQYQVLKAHSGIELLERLRELRPDMILIDIQMPGIDGLETIRRIRSNVNPLIAATPIIAVTALAMAGDRERCLEAGANEYMSKPVKLLELTVLIQELIEKNRPPV